MLKDFQSQAGDFLNNLIGFRVLNKKRVHIFRGENSDAISNREKRSNF